MRWEVESANVFTRHPDQNVFGRYPIEPHAVSEVVADFTFYPPICHDREPLITNVIFTDNYGDEHPLRSVRFRYVGQ
jgi:hypothetical protein